MPFLKLGEVFQNTASIWGYRMPADQCVDNSTYARHPNSLLLGGRREEEGPGHKLCGPQPGHYWSTHSTPPTLSTHLHSPKTYPGSLKVPLFNKNK